MKHIFDLLPWQYDCYGERNTLNVLDMPRNIRRELLFFGKCEIFAGERNTINLLFDGVSEHCNTATITRGVKQITLLNVGGPDCCVGCRKFWDRLPMFRDHVLDLALLKNASTT